MNLNDRSKILVTCARGIAPFLEEEAGKLGFKAESAHETGIVVEGSLGDTYILNLELRTAYNVLFLLKKFECASPDDLYVEGCDIEWEKIIPPDEYLSVVSQADNPTVKNTMFASQKLKDAIVDRMTEKTARRPDSGPDRKNVVVNLYWKDRNAWIYLNTSGGKLSDRGYRKIPLTAPMQEALASAVILAAGYDGSGHFVNPMCGSGTLAIEAALIALGRAPGLSRSNFGFMHLACFDKKYWETLRKKALDRAGKELNRRIIATDRSRKAVDAARENAKACGVDHLMEFGVCDFSATPIPAGKGIVMLNPEYGVRMGNAGELAGTYKAIGDFFKQKCKLYTGYIFTGNLDLAKKVGLAAKRRIPFKSGDLDCRLLEYEIY